MSGCPGRSSRIYRRPQSVMEAWTTLPAPSWWRGSFHHPALALPGSVTCSSWHVPSHSSTPAFTKYSAFLFSRSSSSTRRAQARARAQPRSRSSDWPSSSGSSSGRGNGRRNRRGHSHGWRNNRGHALVAQCRRALACAARGADWARRRCALTCRLQALRRGLCQQREGAQRVLCNEQVGDGVTQQLGGSLKRLLQRTLCCIAAGATGL